MFRIQIRIFWAPRIRIRIHYSQVRIGSFPFLIKLILIIKHTFKILKVFKFHRLKHKKEIFCTLKVTEDFGPDPHPDPLVRGTDPYQNVTDPEHCLKLYQRYFKWGKTLNFSENQTLPSTVSAPECPTSRHGQSW